jgi:hypothetical protein
MRDDFLIHCNRHEELRPLFSELTPLDPPAGAALRRALTQPALQCGYRFEDDELVEEMLAEVEGERGALPMLAFAAARLWDNRDREGGLLTRQACHDIGGVGGALARHAEAAIDRIGTERVPIVREIFRNLVTAEGTRAVREWDELLSVFSESESELPEEILHELIDARLLTAYEVRDEDRETTRHVEIIHESLLASWPRLVRWQTQDADAAQLRDQLRQAARTWHEHDRSDDMLWTGSAYQDFAVWRERYPGGLSDLEEAFASAMTVFASRRRRRRRIVTTAVLVLAIVLAAVFGTLWRRSVLETRRAEASKLLAIAQVQIETDPTEALAYATASLELADNYEARVFTTRALSAGPPVRVLDIRRSVGGMFWESTFSPDGRWLALAALNNENVLVYGERGGDPIILGGHVVPPTGPIRCGWSGDGLLVTGHPTEERVRVWKIPEGRAIRTIDFGQTVSWGVGEEHLIAEIGPGAWAQPGPTRLMRWKLPDGEAEDLGLVDFGVLGARQSIFHPGGEAWLYATGDGAYSRPLPIEDGAPDRVFLRPSSGGVWFGGWRRPVGIITYSEDGNIIWTMDGGTLTPGRRLPWPEANLDSGTSAVCARPDLGP